MIGIKIIRIGISTMKKFNTFMENKNNILKILFNSQNLKILFLIIISSFPLSALVNAKNESNHNLFQENSSINHLDNKNLLTINKNFISNLNKDVNQSKDDKYLNTLVEEVDKLNPYIEYRRL